MQNRSYFMLSIDTEISIARLKKEDKNPEHVFATCFYGQVGKHQVGISYIMDLLEKRKMKGVFFVDFASQYYVGETVFRKALDSILERGHDIQLHLHPDHCQYSDDEKISRLSTYKSYYKKEYFRQVLEIAVESFEKIVGYAPIAYRNGAYYFTYEMIEVLSEYGFKYDSTIFSFKNWLEQGKDWARCRGTPFKFANGIIELPVSWVARVEEKACNQFTTIRSKNLLKGFDYFFSDNTHSMFYMSLIHSYTLMKETRTQRPEFGKEVYFGYEGIDTVRVNSLNYMLDSVYRNDNIQAVTFLDLQQMNYMPYNSEIAATPYPIYYTKSGSCDYGWLRIYNSSYIDEMKKFYEK